MRTLKLTAIIAVLVLALLVPTMACSTPTATPIPTKAPVATSAPAPTVAAAVSTASPTPAGPSTAQYQWRLAIVQTPQDPLGQSWAYFSSELEKRSNGKIHVEVGYSSAFGAQAKEVELTRTGVVQMMGDSTAFASAVEPRIAVMDLPFLFKDSAEYLKLANETTLLKPLTDGLSDKGLLTLAWFDMGARAFDTTSKPIATAADLNGMKFRVLSSTVVTRAWRAWGVQTVTMSAGEVAGGLEAKVIDGIDYLPTAVWSLGQADFIKYITISNHAPTPIIFLMNKPTFDKLPADLQEIVRKTATDTVAFHLKKYNDQLGQAQTALEAKGVKIIQMAEPERAKLLSALAGVYQETTTEFPILKDIIEARDRLRK